MISEGHLSRSTRSNSTWSGNPLSWKDSESRVWNIVLEWATVDGAPHPIGISISLAEGEGFVSPTFLGKLPIRALSNFDLQHGGARRSRSESEIQTSPKSRGPQRGQALDPKILEQVAGLYRQALESGLPPSTVIARAFVITESTAAKRIMAARKAGFLGPASRGKKGEKPNA